MNSELETKVSSVNAQNASGEAAREIESVLNSGIEAAKSGNRDEAKALLFRVTDIDPQNEMAWLWLASVSEYPEELLTFLQKVLSINPENEQALEWERSTKGLLARNLVQYGITAVQEDKKDAARRCFLRALETDENNEMAWLWMASITDVPEEKAANLEKVLSINPNNEVAGTLLKLLQKNEAQELLQKSRSSAVMGNRQEALEILEQIKQLDAELDEVWILQAHLSESFDEKVLCFNQALACNPNNEAARVGLSSLESIMQAVKPAENLETAGVGPANLDRVEDIAAGAIGFDSPELKEEVEAAQYAHDEEVNEASESVEGSFEKEPAFETEGAYAFSENGAAAEINEEVLFDSSDDQPKAEEAAAFDRSEQVEKFSGLSEDEIDFAGLSHIEENGEEAMSFDEATMPEETAAVETDASDEAASMEASESFDTEEKSVIESLISEEVEEAVENDAHEMAEINAETEVQEEIFSARYDNERVVEEEAGQKIASAAPEDVIDENAAFKFEPFDSSQIEDMSFETSLSDMPAENNSEAEQNSFVDSGIKAETYYLGQSTNGASVDTAVEETVENNQQTPAPVETPVSSSSSEMSAQLSVCPFCSVENNINDEMCIGCNAVLGLYNLDMLLSNQDVDQHKVAEAIEFMKAHLEDDSFTAEEYYNLGLACLNVKDLESGMKYLQKSYILNPTNSFLKAQIDELAKRMDNGNQELNSDLSSTEVGSKTIMVVDDSATIRKLVSAKLEKHGHTVIAAVDGMEALAKLEELVPDLILLDITMPRLDGYQVCKLIRANENTRFVPIVLISGKDGFFDKVRGKMCGSTSYITKPFGPEMLLRAVEAYSK